MNKWFNWVNKLPPIAAKIREGNIEAFRLAHKDVLETMKDDIDRQAEELAKKKLAELLVPFDPNYIITFNQNTHSIFIGDSRADDSRLANLKQEAEALERFDLWKILYESPKALAERSMFVAGESLDDMKKGRSVLFTLATQKRILDTCKSYQPPKIRQVDSA